MFGLDILDVILGLAFVYLLLSLIASAINEYLASMLNKRGKVLVEGIDRLLKDTGVEDAFFEHPLILTHFPELGAIRSYTRSIAAKPVGTRWLFRLVNWVSNPAVRAMRYPSYLPSRTFALSLLQAAGYVPDGGGTPAGGGRGAAAPGVVADPGTLSGVKPSATAAPGAADTQVVPTSGSTGVTTGGSTAQARPTITQILKALEAESTPGVTPLPDLAAAQHLAAAALPDDVKQRLLAATTGVGDQFHQMQNSVEVWFNNAMDRVSGAYKRHTQYALFWIGLAVAFALNADTLDLWRRLSTNSTLRSGLATQAAAALPRLAAVYADSISTADSVSRAAVDSLRARGGGNSATGTATPRISPPNPDTLAKDTTSATSRDTAGPARTQPTSLPSDSSQTSDPGARADSAAAAARIASPKVRSARDSVAHARAVFDSATAVLERTNLNFGWSWPDLEALGMARRATKADSAEHIQKVNHKAARRAVAALPKTAPRADSAVARRAVAMKPALPSYVYSGGWKPWPILAKLLGLLLTALALSLGAPFWFDTLNKIINIRAAGRAPQEVPRTPAGAGKRPDERATK